MKLRRVLVQWIFMGLIVNFVPVFIPDLDHEKWQAIKETLDIIFILGLVLIIFGIFLQRLSKLKSDAKTDEEPEGLSSGEDLDKWQEKQKAKHASYLEDRVEPVVNEHELK